MKHVVNLIAEMDGVGEIGPKDQVFLLVKRIASDGSTMSREQYPATSFVQDPVVEGGGLGDLSDAEEYARRLADAPDIVIDYED